MFVAIVSVVVVAVAVLAYFDRANLKSEIKTFVAKAEATEKSIVSRVTAAELNLRGKIVEDTKKIVTEIRAWEAKEQVSAKDVITQFEARLKQIL